MIYRLIFSVAALYNIAFGIWACFWPRALFAIVGDGAYKLSEPLAATERARALPLHA
jgi:hypothetical protein